jgi:type VII secretion protein EccB
MQSKRDQLQAHNFVVGRLRSALLRGDADAVETPTRRFSVAAFAGGLIGLVLVAGCGVLGFIFPASTDEWRDQGVIIVEKETGSRYLYLDGALRPVLNLASARLLTGASAKVVSTSSKSLKGVPHGRPIGIPNAPDALPKSGDLTTTPWLVCATTTRDASGSARPSVSVVVGDGPSITPVGPNSAVVVQTPDGTIYLAWQDRRLKVASPAALVAMGYRGVTPLQVPLSWVNALPQGLDLKAPVVLRRGSPGMQLNGRQTRVGQVFVADTTGADRDFYLMMPDGLLALTPTVAALTLTDPAVRTAYPGIRVAALPLGADEVVSVPRSATSPDWSGYPTTPPKPVDVPQQVRSGGGTLCSRLAFSAGADPKVELVLADVTKQVRRPEAQTVVRDALTADQVVVGAGKGVVVRGQPTAGVRGATLYLITDLGVKYPIASNDAATALGYAGVSPLEVPTVLLTFLPTGPSMDPTKAGVTFTG